MRTINKLIGKGLWLFGPSAIAILFGFATNSALKTDGIIFGNPHIIVQYQNAPPPHTVSMNTDPALLTKHGMQLARAAGGVQ